ncbi:MAG: hypothetical protein E7411_08485 [Ruminococcaceae bacterium]|nr:hypothetical protein [Oscillospiraceae bacterium]
MITDNTQVAYLCNSCQDYEIKDITLFDFSGVRQKEYTCECKGSTLKITKNANKTFKVDFFCPVCRSEHSYTIPFSQFFSEEVFSFSCPHYEAEVLFVGKKDLLEKRVHEYVDETIGQSQDFEYPMDADSLEGIVKLSKLVYSDPDKIRFCGCKGSYSVAYNEKAIYIICDECNLSLPIAVDKVNIVLEEILK